MCPILFRFGEFPVYAYGFFIALGFITGFVLATWKARKEGIPFERVVDLFFYTLFSSLVGARILFILINLDSYLSAPFQIFRIWEGGLVFYGGLVLALATALWYMRWHRLPVWEMADLFTPSIALGLFFGRMGCFFAGCCYGKETSLPWKVTFTNPESLAPLHIPLHPTQLYDAANGLAIFFFLLWMERRKRFHGQIFWTFVLLYAVTRFLIEIFRGDPRGFLLGSVLSTSQVIGIALAIASLFMLSYLLKAKRR